MASKTKDFFETATPKQFEAVLNLYDQALRLKAENKSSKPDNIIKLDKWYQNDLPKKIKSRGKDAHLTHDEMVQTIKWKLARGKFRPNLANLVMMNTPRVCIQETKKAFRKLYKDDFTGAVQALCNLKGVGPAMASAVLAAGAPHLAPFMADECLWAMPDVDSLDYTIKEYLSYVEHVNACVERINENGASNWTPHKVELAVWTHYVLYDLKPEILQNLPSAKNSISASDRIENKIQNEGTKNDAEDNNSKTPAAKPLAEKADLSSPASSTVPPDNSISTSDRVEDKINEGATNDADDTNSETLAAKPLVENSTDLSSPAASTVPPETPENQINPDTVISSINGQEQNCTPAWSNGQDEKSSDTSAPSPSQKNHDIHLSPANLNTQRANGTSGNEAKIIDTSINRPLQDEPSVNITPENGNSENGTSEVPPNEETSAAAVTPNNVEEDWVVVEKEDCPRTQSLDDISIHGSTKRFLPNSEEGKALIETSGDGSPPLHKKLRVDEPICDQNTIEVIKKQQQEQMAETVTSPTKVDNGSSLVV